MNACATYTLACLISKIIQYLQIAIMLIISLAVVTFIWNVYVYFFTDKPKAEAGKYVLYSVLGFFVILSFWGFVAIISNTLNLPNSQPQWPFGGGGVQYQQNNLFNSGNVPPPGSNSGSGFVPPPGSNNTIPPPGSNNPGGLNMPPPSAQTM